MTKILNKILEQVIVVILIYILLAVFVLMTVAVTAALLFAVDSAVGFEYKSELSRDTCSVSQEKIGRLTSITWEQDFIQTEFEGCEK